MSNIDKDVIKEETEEIDGSMGIVNENFRPDLSINDSVNQSCNFNDDDIGEEIIHFQVYSKQSQLNSKSKLFIFQVNHRSHAVLPSK